jgi:hypothetical protein
MAVKIDRYRQQTSTPRVGISPGNPQVVAGPDLGGALLQAAGAIAGVAAERKRQQDEIKAATGAAWSAKFLGETQSELTRLRPQWEAEGGDTGEGVVEKTKAYMEQRRTLATEQAPDDDSRNFTTLKLTEYATAQDIAAFEFETQRRKEWTLVTQDQGIEAAASAASSDYAGAASLAAVQTAAIDGNPLISPLDKRKLKVAAVERIAMGAALGEAERNPYGMRSSILSTLGVNPKSSVQEIVLQRDSAIAALEKIEADEGVAVPEDQRSAAVAALMGGGGIAVNKATGEITVTRGDQSGAAGRGPWAIEALSVPQRIELLSKVEAEIGRRETDAKQRAEGAKVFLQQRAANTLTALENGEPVPLMSLGELQAAYGPERGAIVYREMQVKQSNAGWIAEMRGMTNAELVASLSAGPTGTEDRQPRQEAWNYRVTRIKAEIDARNADPGGYVLQNAPSVKESYDHWQRMVEYAGTPGASADAPARAIAAQSDFIRNLFAEQRRLGYTDPKLPAAYVDAAAARFNEMLVSGDPEVAAREVEFAVQAMVNTPAALAQFAAKLPVAGQFAIDGVPGLTARKLAEQAKVKDADRSELLAARGVAPSEVDEAVADQFAEFTATFGGRPEASAAQARYLEAGKLLAVEALSSGRATDAKAAARMAYEELYGERNTVAGGLRIPKQYEPDAVVNGLRVLQFTDITERVAIPIEPGMTADETREGVAFNIRRNGRWVTNGTGTGAILFVGGEAVKDVDGKPIEVSYDEAVQAAPTVEPSADVETRRRGALRGRDF